MMLLTLALCLAAVPVQDPAGIKITMSCENATVGEILDTLKELTAVPIELDDAARKKLDSASRTSFSVQDISLKDALKLLLEPHGLSATLVDKKKFVVSVAKGK